MDLNADVGEECGDDAALLALVTSANIACGAHAGNTAVMRRTVDLALRYRVSIGAHVSYPDREHFGRIDMEMAPAVLSTHVFEQLGALAHVARVAGAAVRYVKAHGALYNRMARDTEVADAVLTGMARFNATLPLLTLPGSAAAQCAERRGMTVVAEAFADRAYQDDGSLVPRSRTGAVLHDPALVARRALKLVREGVMETASGKDVKLKARSLCVHGDTPEAVAMAHALRAALQDAGVELRAFA